MIWRVCIAARKSLSECGSPVKSIFCCPAHKRLYNEEHSRLGLARLLEEVAPDSVPGAVEEHRETAEVSVSRDLDRDLDTSLAEPELVASGQGLHLWTYPHLGYPLEARFGKFSKIAALPVPYSPGEKGKKKAETLDVDGPEIVRPASIDLFELEHPEHVGETPSATRSQEVRSGAITMPAAAPETATSKAGNHGSSRAEDRSVDDSDLPEDKQAAAPAFSFTAWGDPARLPATQLIAPTAGWR